MKKTLQKLVRYLGKFTDRPWYLTVIAGLAGLDLFILVVPTDTFLISHVAFHPKRWLRTFLFFTTASSLGAVLMAALVSVNSNFFVQKLVLKGFSAEFWSKTEGFIHGHGAWAMAAHAFGPFPLQPAVVIAGAAKMNLLALFAAVWVGRGVKYFIFAWAARYTPQILAKFFKFEWPDRHSSESRIL